MNVRNVRVPQKVGRKSFYLASDGRLFNDLPSAKAYRKKLSDITLRFIVVSNEGLILLDKEVPL